MLKDTGVVERARPAQAALSHSCHKVRSNGCDEECVFSFGDSLLRRQSWNSLSAKLFKALQEHHSLWWPRLLSLHVFLSSAMLAENYQSGKAKLLQENLLILSKPSNKTSREDGLTGPVPCLVCFQTSMVFWSFFSPPLSWGSLDGPLPRCSQPGRLPGGRRHLHGPCLSPHALLATSLGSQGAATYVVWPGCPLGCLAFRSFPRRAGSIRGRMLAGCAGHHPAGSETTQCSDILSSFSSILFF